MTDGSDDPGPGEASAPEAAFARGAASGDGPLPDLPSLTDPLGPVDATGLPALPADGVPTVPGRRAAAVLTPGGVDLWAHPWSLARGLTVRGAEVRDTVVTPLGAERALDVAGATVTERVVVSRDAPVCWIEWVAGAGVELELGWRVEIDSAAGSDPAAGAASGEPVAPRGPDGATGLSWRETPRGLWVERADGAVRIAFALSAPPELRVSSDDDGALAVRARLRVPAGDGVRVAVVGAAPTDDLDRLLRIAGRTRVAVPARRGAIDRLLQDGFRVTASDPDVARAVDGALARLDAARLETADDGPWLVARGGRGAAAGSSPAAWSMADAFGTARALLVAGRFDTVRDFLGFLVRHQRDDGRVPGAGVGPRRLRYDDPRATPRFLRLVARYLAWSGDLAGTRARWDAVTRAVGACREAAGGEEGGRGEAAREDGTAPARERRRAFAALAVAAEELGDTALAAALATGGVDGADGADELDEVGASDEPDGLDLLDWSEQANLGGLHAPRLLAILPDAPRGRLVLRPRPPAGWSRLEARGLVVGDAAVDVAYHRQGDRHRVTVAQRRGAAPLQLVLEPELGTARQNVTATRVDGTAAELDPTPAGGRWRVPVQLALDHARTLEVEFDGPDD